MLDVEQHVLEGGFVAHFFSSFSQQLPGAPGSPDKKRASMQTPWVFYLPYSAAINSGTAVNKSASRP
jgi:hypothetical protein